jgi:hypothetical protein
VGGKWVIAVVDHVQNWGVQNRYNVEEWVIPFHQMTWVDKGMACYS